MSSHRPDVAEILKQERQYHLEQIQRIDVALAALDTPPSIQATASLAIPAPQVEAQASQQSKLSPKTLIPWTKELRAIFAADDWAELSTEEIDNRLVARGVPRDIIEENRNTLSGTISRLISKGEVQRIAYGKIGRNLSTSEQPKPSGADPNPEDF